MSGLSGGLAPMDTKKKSTGSSKDAGAILDNILDRKDKPSTSASSRHYGMDDSFDSFNSTSLASETSLPSPSPAKGVKSGLKKSPDNYFAKSTDLGDSVQDLESSVGDFGGYQPSAGRPLSGGVSDTGKSRSGNQRDVLDSSFDSSYEASPVGQKRPTTTGGIAEESSSAVGIGNRPYTADGIEDLEGSTGGGGYNPTMMASGGRSRQRRSLAVEDSSQQQNVADSLDELDKALGFGGGIASAPAVAPPAPQSRLQGYDSSDDEAYNPNKPPPTGASSASASVPASALGASKPAIKTELAADPVGIKKNLTVRVDVQSDSSSSSAAPAQGTTESNASSGSYPASEYILDATPSRQAVRSIPSSATASSPAWLGSAPSPSGGATRARSPKNVGHIGTGGIGSSAADLSMADQTIRNMQQNAESAQLEREAVERQLRTEIEGLKRDLTRSHMGLAGVSDDQIKEYGEGSVRQMREVADLKRKVAQQDMELARLRDEATLKDYKHVEEVKRIKEVHGDELKEADRRKAEDILSVERRHEETVATLKRIHLEELNAIKERGKENSALDQLAGQLKSATGSIKLLEEQLLSKYRGLDAAKDGQMEARERLLAEMEEKARTRVDTAEAEGYRLKGVLMHMEHVAGTLRGQGGEEKERLRQEHQRLHSLQLSLDAERNAFQHRVDEELSLLKKKMEECEGETRRLNQEKREQMDRLAGERRELDADKTEFSSYVISHTKHAEATAAQFQDEEKRLNRIKEELERDRLLLEQRKSAAAADIQEADRIHSAVSAAREEVSREKAKLQQAVSELNTASLSLTQQGDAMEKLKRVLDQREIGVREANAQMKIASSKLNQREMQLDAKSKECDRQMGLLAEADREITKKRVELASKVKKASQSSAGAALHDGAIIIQPRTSPAPGKPERSKNSTGASPPSSSSTPAFGGITSAGKGATPETPLTDWMHDFKARLDEGRHSGSGSSGSGGRGAVDAHLLEAKRSLLSAKGNLIRSATTRQATNRMLAEDTSFMSFLQSQRARAAWTSSSSHTGATTPSPATER